MAKKVILLSFLLVSLSACIPNMNGQYPNQNQNQYYGSSYRQQPMMNNGYNNDMYSQNELFKDEADISGYSKYPSSNRKPSVDNIPQNPWAAAPAPVQSYQQNTMVQGAQPYPVQVPAAAPMPPMHPVAGMPHMGNQYNVQARQYHSKDVIGKGVVGIGQTLSGTKNNVTDVSVNRVQAGGMKKSLPNSVESNSNLIAPGSWRMAHPSIGNGLELINQTERFSLNNELNDVKIKKTANIKIGGQKVTVLGLNAAPVTNLKGYLCKEVYLVKSKNGGQVKTMWGKFCRHPNWNEWILTKW